MFKQRKHRTFNYQPRFSEENKADYSLNDNDKTKDFISKWRAGRDSKTKVRGMMSMRILILALVLLLICMYLLEKKYM
ncbi:hypothetical protein WJN01_00725 [Flavobacteriaceae bacterium SZ-1-7]|uniref:hypothetical protein n=1 Tax=Tamlana sedimenti TaxID=3134126 RepID=UPI00312ACD5E